MIRIYHVPVTRSHRVIWLAEELGLEYEARKISFRPEFRMSDEWLTKNPVGKVPAMDDGELTLFESGAMVQYLLDRYGEGRLQPEPGTPAHAIYLQWSWFAEATFARPLGEIVNHRRNFSPEHPEIIEEMQSRALLCVAALDRAVRDREFLCGEFSAADIMMGYSLKLCERLAPHSGYGALEAYWQRLQARPACQRAFADYPHP